MFMYNRKIILHGIFEIHPKAKNVSLKTQLFWQRSTFEIRKLYNRLRSNYQFSINTNKFEHEGLSLSHDKTLNKLLNKGTQFYTSLTIEFLSQNFCLV